MTLPSRFSPDARSGNLIFQLPRPRPNISDRIDQWPRAFGFSTQEQLEYLFDNRHNATALAGHLQIVTDALYVLTRDCTLDAEWYVVDNYVPDMMYLGDGKPLDIANEEDREELIHRLQRIQRHIVKRLRSAPPSSDLPGIGPQCSATDIAKLPWEKFPMAEEDEAGPPSKRKAKKSTRSKSPGAKAAKLRATAKGTRSPKRKAKKKRK